MEKMLDTLKAKKEKLKELEELRKLLKSGKDLSTAKGALKELIN